MYLARVSFGPHNRHDDDELFDAVEWYLSSLISNGQIGDDYLLAWSGGACIAYVSIAAKNAYAMRNHTSSGKEFLHKVIKLFGTKPKWEVLDDKSPMRTVSWRTASSLVLYTTVLNEESPVSRGDNGRPIPLYSLPFPLAKYKQEEIYRWASAYRHHENVWLMTSTLEVPAYKEIAEPDSELSHEGRTLCSEIEAVTGKPTYYYLFRYWGFPKGEEARLCPGCGKKWRDNAVVYSENSPFWQFHFRCTPCRLVSHIGLSCDEKRRAHIGTYRKQS